MMVVYVGEMYTLWRRIWNAIEIRAHWKYESVDVELFHVGMNLQIKTHDLPLMLWRHKLVQIYTYLL